ncbi:TPA: hypothetical protein VA418_001509 [Streptococcus agalactiae]|nr:hypothetical protein [Streptococcus agalactiae]
MNLNLADYNRLFGDNTLFDELDKLPKPDLIIASPPCESWSNASAMSESDCCAHAGGEFQNVKLDAVITDVKIGEQVKEESDWGETTSTNTVTIYHNQNPIALAECEANDGNGGFYYSVGSLIIGKIHFPVVEA